MRNALVIAAAVFALAGCSSRAGTYDTDSGGGSGQTLSEAFCSDMRAGLSVNQTMSGGSYRGQDAADKAYGFAAISCPEQLQTNEGLRAYLDAWNINPDA